jgi:hypothetical protein
MRLSGATNPSDESQRDKEPDKQFVEVELGVFGKARFNPDCEWRRYMTFFTIPTDTLDTFRTNLIIRMPGHGVAWLDEMKVYKEK